MESGEQLDPFLRRAILRHFMRDQEMYLGMPNVAGPHLRRNAGREGETSLSLNSRIVRTRLSAYYPSIVCRSIDIQHKQKEFRRVLNIVINSVGTYLVRSIKVKEEAVGHRRIVIGNLHANSIPLPETVPARL
jgi:hypothetical protein